tara:strand:- start:104 stop:490 length:387 start_codon:yes stop_codon:yes gene_type:complete
MPGKYNAEKHKKYYNNRSFHDGLTKKQFITLGYAILAYKRGIMPTCRNIRDFMEESESFKDNPEVVKYQNVRATFDQLENNHKCVKGMPSAFTCDVGRAPNAFYATKKGIDKLKSFLGVQKEIGQHNT